MPLQHCWPFASATLPYHLDFIFATEHLRGVPSHLNILIIKHCSLALRNNQTISEIYRGQKHTKLFTIDLLLYVTQPHTYMPSIIQEFNHFSSLLNNKVNYSKSEILNASLTGIQEVPGKFQVQILLQILLGIHIPSYTSQLLSRNFFLYCRPYKVGL